MDKEKLVSIASESVIISKVKLGIFKVIEEHMFDRFIPDYRIIAEINKTPIYELRYLSNISRQSYSYGERIRRIVNDVLKRLK